MNRERFDFHLEVVDPPSFEVDDAEEEGSRGSGDNEKFGASWSGEPEGTVSTPSILTNEELYREIVLNGNDFVQDRVVPSSLGGLNDAALGQMMRQIGFESSHHNRNDEESFSQSTSTSSMNLAAMHNVLKGNPNASRKSPRNTKEQFHQEDDIVDETSAEGQAIQKHNRAIRWTRGIMFCVLLIVCGLALCAVYRFTKSNEADDFEKAFDSVAQSMTSSLLVDIRFKFWLARSTAAFMSSYLAQVGSDQFLNISISSESLDEMTRTQRLITFATAVAWSPYVRTEEERVKLESSAKEQLDQSTGPSPKDICWICDPSEKISNPETIVDIPGFGRSVTCGNIAVAGQNGVIAPQNCALVQHLVSQVCLCETNADLFGESGDTGEHELPTEIFNLKNGRPTTETSDPPFHPIWIQSVNDQVKSSFLFNQASDPARENSLSQMTRTGRPVMSQLFNRTGPYYEQYAGVVGEPGFIIYSPVFVNDESSGEPRLIGSIMSEFVWRGFVQTSVYPAESDLLVDVVIENTCGQIFTFRLEGDDLVLAGTGDLHNTKFSETMHSTTFEDFETIVGISSSQGLSESPELDQAEDCLYRFMIYATSEFEEVYETNKPALSTVISAAVFAVLISLFLLYDFLVQQRQKQTLFAAQKSNALVSSLFPQQVRSRLLDEAGNQLQQTEIARQSANLGSAEHPTTFIGKIARRSSLTSIESTITTRSPTKNVNKVHTSPPIAEQFNETTIIFLDIVGFTAWSSEREPSEVFMLLEALYSSFDEAARRLGVFKIETIGDCYVAATGVPKQMAEHAVIMCRFAHECIKRMQRLLRQLEIQLGPATADLKGRIGIHSGSVTGGVLRGEKARFQLFGDTMNTASRMESTSIPGKIQCSTATADLLISAGKKHWLEPRNEPVSVKGKGEMTSFWVNLSGRNHSRSETAVSELSDEAGPSTDTNSNFGSSASIDLDGPIINGQRAKMMRYVEWNVEVMYELLQKLATARNSKYSLRPKLARNNSFDSLNLRENDGSRNHGYVVDEVSDSIDMPRYDARVSRKLSLDTTASGESRAESIHMGDGVRSQLQEYVMRIASLYPEDNAFHNFEHCSHAAMSANKLLKRLIQPKDAKTATESPRETHFRTFGISSDHLMHFVIHFAMLIHDVDHPGLPNDELIKMRTPASIIYKNRSVAEQNSLEVAWRVLLDDDFTQLRGCIYSSKVEMKRFRQLLVNAVVATDIFDPVLKVQREKRWSAAFPKDEKNDLDRRSSHRSGELDRKASLVFETIIRASDVAHMMQHWQTYTKFNERLFIERYSAFAKGQAASNPKDSWYAGELTFFDNYVIPLAEQLQFVLGDGAFREWALQNRDQWEKVGRSVVERMHQVAVARQHSRSKSHSSIPVPSTHIE